MGMTDDVKERLRADLPREGVKTRQGDGKQLSYIEGWYAIAQANEVFGFEWDSVIVEQPHIIDRYEKSNGNRVAVVQCTVRVTACGVVHEGVGVGIADGKPDTFYMALEKAMKEAETDATKRALKNYGMPLGLALYDRNQEHIGDAAPEPQRPAQTSSKPVSVDATAAAKIATYGERIDQAHDLDALRAIGKEIAGESDAVKKAISGKYNTRYDALGGERKPAKQAQQQQQAPSGPPATSSMMFKFGRGKDTPIADLDDESLDWYAGCFENDLADESKARFHDKTQGQLDAVRAEQSYRASGGRRAA